MKDFWNILLFAIILLGIYLFITNYNFNKNMEGLENLDLDARKAARDNTSASSTSSTSSTSSNNGIASNSLTYLTNIKNVNMRMKDQINISNSEYRKNYEDIVLAVDDLITNVMLTTTLTIDPTKPEESIIKLSQLNQARAGLNNVLKFIDKQ
jgi:hypothetical protein